MQQAIPIGLVLHILIQNSWLTPVVETTKGLGTLKKTSGSYFISAQNPLTYSIYIYIQSMCVYIYIQVFCIANCVASLSGSHSFLPLSKVQKHGPSCNSLQ